MSTILQVIAVVICIGMMFLLFNKMKQKAISEQQALLWILGAVGLLILSCFPQILTGIADKLGVWWAPATLIFFLLIILILIIFYHSITISRMEAEIKELAMQTALLQEQNARMKEALKEARGVE